MNEIENNFVYNQNVVISFIFIQNQYAKMSKIETETENSISQILRQHSGRTLASSSQGQGFESRINWTTLFYPGINLIKLFAINLLTLFCKLDHFINVDIILLCGEKTHLLKRVSTFAPKKFYEIDPLVKYLGKRLYPIQAPATPMVCSYCLTRKYFWPSQTQ